MKVVHEQFCPYCGARAIDARVDGDGSIVFLCADHLEHRGPVDRLFDRATVAKRIALKQMRDAIETRKALRATVRDTRALIAGLRTAMRDRQV